MRPVEIPFTRLTDATLQSEMSSVIRLYMSAENPKSTKPAAIRTRLSMNPMSRPTTMAAHMAPTPRGLSASPLCIAG